MVYSIRHSSRQDAQIPLLLVYLGENHPLEYSRYPNGTGFFQWYYCTEGTGEFHISGTRMILNPGQCAMVMPDSPFSCIARSAGCRVHLLGFTGKCCREILHFLSMDAPGVFQVSDLSVIPEHIGRLVNLYHENPFQREYAKVLFSLFLDMSPQLKKVTDSGSPSSGSESVRRVLEYLEVHYAGPVSLDMLSEDAGLTKEYLCVLFKKETGRTILQQLTLIRIGRARLYLEQFPDKTVYEIGKMCGFDSPSYFGKQFKKLVGMTPESYRRTSSIIL